MSAGLPVLMETLRTFQFLVQSWILSLVTKGRGKLVLVNVKSFFENEIGMFSGMIHSWFVGKGF